jgi:ribonuclease Z
MHAETSGVGLFVIGRQCNLVAVLNLFGRSVRVVKVAALFLVTAVLAELAPFHAQTAASQPDGQGALRVVLLGTQGGPTFNAQRLGISTLVLAGGERLLFDAGRGVTSGLSRAAINPADVSKVFLTHLHSDHVISLPELLISPWASQGRQVALRVWGPSGTRRMMQKFQEALAFDIHVRRDVDEKLPAEGVRVVATDIREGVVYASNGVTVTAFLVDHGPVKPAFGYRVDFRGHSVAMSGDTGPSDNLVRFATGVDLLIHDVGRFKGDPALAGSPDELLPNSRQTRGQAKAVAAHHTDGVEVGQVLARVKPKLALLSHYNVDPQATLPLIQRNYAGAVEFGEDAMTVDVGDAVIVNRAASAR